MNKEKDIHKKNVIDSYDFFNKESVVEEYTRMYGKINFQNEYPANLQRLLITLSLLKEIKPNNLVDAGCGTGMPLIEILNNGIDASGYDKSKNMVEKAKSNLEKANHDPNRVTIGDFENPINIAKNSIECITGMGTFYYANNVEKTLINQKDRLKRNGHLIFSLRNKLFDLVTLNDYSNNFLSDLFTIDEFSKEIQEEFFKLLPQNKGSKNSQLNIDDHGVKSLIHNPLTIKELLNSMDLSLKGIYFYHYHSLPPSLENKFVDEFRTSSWEKEDPLSWKGYFLASCFIVLCQKN